MARTRSVKIEESVGELEELRRTYAGRPEGQRLFFLQLLAEDNQRSISEAARKSEISERRGRYWWDAYRKGGLQELLDRRAWRQNQKWTRADSTRQTRSERTTDTAVLEDVGSESSTSWVSFVTRLSNAAMSASDFNQSLRQIKLALEECLAGVKKVGVNLHRGLDVLNPGSRKRTIVSEMSVSDEGRHASADANNSFSQPYELFLHSARRAGLQLEQFHPPHAFDFFLDPGKRRVEESDSTESYVGTVVLLAGKNQDDVPASTLNVVERLRPFFSFLFTDLVIRDTLKTNSGAPLSEFLRRTKERYGLTDQESKVLMLGFLGRSYKDMAEQMSVSVSTIRSHIRSLFRKTGVSKMAELHAQFYNTGTDEAEDGGP